MCIVSLLLNYLPIVVIILQFINLRTTGLKSLNNSVPLVVIVESGTTEIEYDSTSIIFYTTLENKGSNSVSVGLAMDKCCQEITMLDIDCESMVLRGDPKSIVFNAGQKQNLSMTFNNRVRYLHGRKGECWLRVNWTQLVPSGNEVSVAKVTHGSELTPIRFNIEIPLSRNHKNLIKLFPGVGAGSCESVDEDPKRNCRPVSCFVKYSGYRNFYNRTIRRCQPNVKCANSNFSNPIPSNCKQKLALSSNFHQKMEEMKNQEAFGETVTYKDAEIKVKCVHGQRQSSDRPCVCDSSWSSVTFPMKTFDPDKDIYVMCDQYVKGSGNQYLKANPQLAIVILFLIIFFVILFCVIRCACLRYWKRKRRDTYLEFAQSSTSSSSDEASLSATKSWKSSTPKSRHTVILPPVSKIPTRSRVLEFSKLAQDENTTHPIPSRMGLGRNNKLKQSNYNYNRPLRYPESFQLKPKGPVLPPFMASIESSRIPGTPFSSASAMSSSEDIGHRWSIPDTSEANLQQPFTISKHSKKLVPLKTSQSAECYPRRLGYPPCTCCESRSEGVPALLNVNVRMDDCNRNPTVLTVRKFSLNDPCINFENIQFPGPSPQEIAEVASKQWKSEIDALLENPDDIL